MTFIPAPYNIPDPSPAYTGPRRAVPPPWPLSDDQDEQRKRRRVGLRVHYRGRFDLALEVSQVCGPLAASVAAMPDPTVMGGRVADVVDAVHELVVTATDMIVTSAATANGSRSATAQHLADLAAKPAPPQVTGKMLADGSWSRVLAAYVAPLSGDLAALLGRALAPNDVRLKGRLAASERLVNALLVLDGAAVRLGRCTVVTDRVQRQPSLAQVQQQRRQVREQRAVQKRLARLGISGERTST
jgi:hypothetical protein